MADVASLSFEIDSSQAQRAIGVLETLRATSIQVTQSTQQLNQANTNRMTSVASIEAGSRWAMGHGHGFKDRSTAVLAIS